MFLWRRKWLSAFVILLLLNGIAFQVFWSSQNHHRLVVAFLNIGQGDAIYIESPDHRNILIDAGPDDSVVRELQKIMRWYDRHISVLMITNPDRDHISGFVSVMNRYSVDLLIEPGTKNPSGIYQAVQTISSQKHIQKIVARRGMRLELGDGAYIQILFPDRDVSPLSTNTGSIIAELVFGKTKVMLTGDAPFQTEEYVASLDGAFIESDILKEGHHGSKTSSSEIFFKAVNPKYDVISAGKNNPYHHPDKETINLLNMLHIPILTTFEEGTIVFVSDGTRFFRKK